MIAIIEQFELQRPLTMHAGHIHRETDRPVTRLNETQIAADVAAFREAGVDGLAISWDLWEIPLKRLELIRANWP